MKRRGLALAVLASLQICAGEVRAAGLVFKIADPPALQSLALGEFAPGSSDRGPIEAQTPIVRLSISDFQVSVETGGEADCDAGIEAGSALVKANGAAANPAADECLFLARITIATDHGALTFEGQCDDWRNDLSYCWVDGDAGQFWVRRQPAKDSGLQVLLGPMHEAPRPALGPAPSNNSQSPPIPERGILIDNVFDDEGRAISDRWLLFPSEVVTLNLKR